MTPINDKSLQVDAPSSENNRTLKDASPRDAIPVRWGRVLLLSLPLIILNGGWIANSEMKSGITEVTISTLFMGVVFVLFVLTLLNLGIRRLFGADAAFNQPELMAVYTLLSMSSVVAGVGHMGFFLTFLGNAFHLADANNGWRDFWSLLPWYVGPRDPAILKPFYEGHSTAFRRDVLMAWSGPMAVWGIFFLILIWTTLCLGVILRRRWADEEHLPFPVIALPLEMTREGAPLYRNKLLWAGFAFPCILHTINTLASISPLVPSWKLNSVHDLVGDGTVQFPWTGMDSVFYMLHPAGIGFGYLINTDVSFSLWFFYLLKKMLDVVGIAAGWRDPSHGWFGDTAAQFPFTQYQGWGAWLALSLTTLWAGRSYFRDYVRRALHGDPAGVDRQEPMSARAAVLGLLAGFLILCSFVWVAGGSLWIPAAFLGIYILIMVAITRIRAETAVLCTELIWINPQSILPALTGTTNLPRLDLAHMGMLSWFNTDYRAVAMPHELEGLVGMHRARGKLSPLVGAILLAAAVAIISSLLWDLQMYYVNGAETGKVNLWRTDKGSEPWNALAKWIHDPKPPDGRGIAGMAVGFVMTFLLAALHSRFDGFPLHPAAYVLNTSFANDFFWCDMFVAWGIKASILRYGGMKTYRLMLPLFLGLILGDFVTGSAWSIIGTLFHLNLFRTFAT